MRQNFETVNAGRSRQLTTVRGGMTR